MLLHASAVAIGGRALLLTGRSGAGKSDLALRLIDRGAELIADDQVQLSVAGGVLLAAAPKAIEGRMEVRGLGVVALSSTGPMPVALILDLDAAPDRMPDPRTLDLPGLSIPTLAFAGGEASAPIKAELALARWGLGA